MRALLVLALLPVLLAGAALAQNSTDNSTASGNATATSGGNATATATMPAPVEFTLTGTQAGGDFVWKGAEGTTNPTLKVPAGAQVTIHVVDDNGFHALEIPSLKLKSDNIQSSGDTAVLTFTAPDSGSLDYRCPYHPTTMKGTIQVESAGGAQEGGNASAPAPTPAPTSFTIVGHDDNGQFFWTLEGQTQHNPTITVAPDSDITVTVKNAGSTPHAFAVEGQPGNSAYVNTPDDVATFKFHSGAEGTSATYYCVPHKTSGMLGTLKFAKEIAPPSSGGGGGTSGVLGTGTINGETVDLGQVTQDSTCNNMQIPAPVADKEVGGPTVADYQKRCDEGGAPQEGVVPSNADYVIPVSLGVIGLGVVGVVWVHKFYRP